MRDRQRTREFSEKKTFIWQFACLAWCIIIHRLGLVTQDYDSFSKSFLSGCCLLRLSGVCATMCVPSYHGVYVHAMYNDNEFVFVNQSRRFDNQHLQLAVTIIKTYESIGIVEIHNEKTKNICIIVYNEILIDIFILCLYILRVWLICTA